MSGRSWHDARRVLAVRLDAMGDLVMTGPALRAVSAGSRRHVTLLASPAGAGVAPLLPGVHDVIEYEAPWMKATPPGRDERRDLALIDELRQRRFDAAVIFTVASQTPHPAATLCWLAGIPLRLAHQAGKTYQLLTDEAPAADAPPDEHEVARQLRLVGQVGWGVDDDRLRLELPADALAAARRLVAALELEADRPWAVLHPGASAPSRRYPPASYSAAVSSLVDDGWQVVVVGTREERHVVEASAPSHPDAHAVVGRLAVAEMAALIALAPVFIGNNSGPAHLAAAVGTPVVSLYALTNTEHMPWRVPSRVLFQDVPCRGCQRSVCPMGHHRCLRAVPPSAVVDAARALFAETVALAGVAR